MQTRKRMIKNINHNKNTGKTHVAILGSTGSIGTQALEVIEQNPTIFELELLTAGSNAKLLIEQAQKFLPNCVVIAHQPAYQEVKYALKHLPIKVYGGQDAIEQAVTSDSINVVLTAMVGYAGLAPTLAAIEAGKNIALANKETLVVAGQLVNKALKSKKVAMLPVDSEHSAIFQCLAGEWQNPIEKIILTASGGPFRGFSAEQLKTVSKTQALKHPNWVMGAKITIDSASLMNKGLEVIEAKWLFDLNPDQIEVIVHPESIIHSMVQFKDGSIKAQMGLPDMKLPIQYALTYPHRLQNKYPRFNFLQYPMLNFQKPDFENFPCLYLAFEALKKGGSLPCVLNAANEIAVDLFLQEKIKFIQIPEIVSNCMQQMPYIAEPLYHDYVNLDRETREKAKSLF